MPAGSGQRQGEGGRPGGQLHDAGEAGEGLAYLAAGVPLEPQVSEQADEGEHRGDDPQGDLAPDRIDDLVRRGPVRGEAGGLALEVGDLLAQLGDEVFELFGAFEEVAALEPGEQAHVEDLEGLEAPGAVVARGFEAVEEVLAGELLAEQDELQRPPLPAAADWRGGAQHGFVDGGAEGVFGIEDVLADEARPEGGALEIVEQDLDGGGEGLGIARHAVPVQQREEVEAVVEQIDEAPGRTVGVRFLRAVVRSDGEQARGSGHGVTAINSIARSR